MTAPTSPGRMLLYNILRLLIIPALLIYAMVVYFQLTAPDGINIHYYWWTRSINIFISTPLTIIAGFLIMRRVPGNLIGPALILFTTASGAELIFAQQMPAAVGSIIIASLTGLGIPAFVVIVTHFPTGTLYPRRIAPIVYFLIAIIFVTGIAIFFGAPTSYGTVFSLGDALPNPFFIPVLESIGIFAQDVGGLLSFVVIMGAIILQIYRYRESSGMERKQIRWLAFGLLISIFASSTPQFAGLLGYGTDSFTLVLGNIGLVFFNLMLPFSIAIGILFYKLWDVDVVINRSLVYGTVVLITIAIFFIASLLIQVIFGNQQIWIALVFSLIVSAAIFNPVRNRVQNLVDRYIYGLRFNLIELGQAQRPITISNPGKLTGQQFGDYEVRGVIGKGGMGEVYDGFSNGQRVAIKTMLPEIAKDPDLKIRFEREVEIGISLKNPHIAEIYSSGEHNGTPYLVMEYIEGQDLGDTLKADGKFDTETAIQIIKDICEALSLAHQQGYIHRDIKPSNIMLRENGSAVLMDFGISKIQDAKTITGTGAVGTIQYMAPEQIISAKDVDHRADIYALGCLLYQMLTGETPFSGGAAQVMFAQIQQPAPDPQDIQADIPGNIADAILKALEKDPDKRFNSVDEFPLFMQQVIII